ncbi:MAG: carbon-nitrogen hydrolase [Gemmatimonadaceae bacterium]|nr:carbon-nitrogen hydrolase [Gemmatimonadaceae bacterium]
MPNAPFTVGLVQEFAGSRDTAANLERAIVGVRRAHERGAQIICLQELFNAPYFCKSLDINWFDLAEPIPGPTTARMQALARELSVVLIVPIYERQAAGLYRNSAAVIDADGAVLGVYRKMHIPHDPMFEEKYYFTPGDAADTALRDPNLSRDSGGFRAWTTRYGTIGVLICWDQWYPEAARITALLGADVLFYPTAIGWHPTEKETFGQDQVTAWRTIQRSHAIANGVFVASPNRVGFEDHVGTRGLEFFGHSVIFDPFGRILTEATTEPDVLVATCDPALIEETRRNWPFLRDRRVDAYGGLMSRYLG